MNNEVRTSKMAARTEEQKKAQDKYMGAIKDIKLRVPAEYLDKIKEYAKSKDMSVNQLVISLLEKEMGEEIVTIREKNKRAKESAAEQKPTATESE